MKKVYISPVVETLECKVEKGFAGSSTLPNSSVNPDNNSGRMGGSFGNGNANSMFN